MTKAKGGSVEVANISITHPERIIDATSGVTKLELAEFYNTISEFILPHLEDRPVSFLRAPDGIAGGQFFQKHAEGRGFHIWFI